MKNYKVKKEEKKKKIEPLKDYEYHKNLKMKSAIKEQMEKSLPSYSKKKGKFEENSKVSEEIIPNSNKDNRIKAYEELNSEIKFKGKPVFQSKNQYLFNDSLNKNTLNSNLNTQNKNEKMNNKEIDSRWEIIEEKIIPEITIDDKYLLSEYEKYYEEKFSHLEKQSKQIPKGPVIFDESDAIPRTANLGDKFVNVKRYYYLGANLYPQQKTIINSSICYNKDDKWLAYTNNIYIIVENFHPDTNRQQLILCQHKISSKFNSIKISNAGRILYASTLSNELVFYDYLRGKFTYLNTYKIPDCKILHDYMITPLNNLCIILYNDYHISCVDFGLGEELISNTASFSNKTGLSFLQMKFNLYLSTNMEFCTINQDYYSYWFIKPSNLTIEEHPSRLRNFTGNSEIICFDYTAPLSVKCIMCLLLGISNGCVVISDYIRDNLLKIYKPTDLFNIERNIKLYDIVASMYYITFIYNDKIKYFTMPSLQNIDYTDMDILKIPKGEISHNSTIITCDIDLINPRTEGISLTHNGSVYYINYNEECTVKLFTFIPVDIYEIQECKIINKNIKNISIQNIQNKTKNNQNNQNGYYFITSHKHGNVRIWNIPEFDMIYVFEVNNSELTLIQTLPNDLKFLAFYSNGNIRCFDIEEGKVTGKINIKTILGEGNYFKQVTFFPDGKYFFAIDNNKNDVYLGGIEKFNELIINFNQVLSGYSMNIKNIVLSYLEPFLIFGINNYDKNVFIYKRKYTEIIRDLSFEKTVPVYELIDSFIPENFCNEFKINNEINNNIENKIIIYFSPLIHQKDQILIFTKKHNLILVRDFKMKFVLKIIKFDSQLINFNLSNSGYYILYMFKNVFKVSEFNPDYDIIPRGTIVPNVINDTELIPKLSQDDKIVLFHNNYSIAFYLIG